MNVQEKVIEVSKILDELSEFNEKISDTTQKYDYMLSDLYHYLENTPLNSKMCYRFCKELKKVLKARRIFKNNASLSQLLESQKEKLVNGKDNRQMLLSNIGKKEKQLHFPYKNRVYDEEELKKIMEG